MAFCHQKTNNININPVVHSSFSEPGADISDCKKAKTFSNPLTQIEMSDVEPH